MTIPNFLTILLRPTDWFPVHTSSSRGSNITAEIPEWSLLLKTLLISWYSSLTTAPPWLSSIFQNNNWSAAAVNTCTKHCSVFFAPNLPLTAVFVRSCERPEKTEVGHRDRIPILLSVNRVANLFILCGTGPESRRPSRTPHSKISGVPPVWQWYGHPRVLGIPIAKTLSIQASPSHTTLAIWVRVSGDTHITRALGMGMPKTRGRLISLWHRTPIKMPWKYWKACSGAYIYIYSEC